jgi:hypothetical protein
VFTNWDNAYKGVTDEHWKKKTKTKIWWLAYQVGLLNKASLDLQDLRELEEDRKDAPKGYIRHKTEESDRGFLVYVSRTY